MLSVCIEIALAISSSGTLCIQQLCRHQETHRVEIVSAAPAAPPAATAPLHAASTAATAAPSPAAPAAPPGSGHLHCRRRQTPTCMRTAHCQKSWQSLTSFDVLGGRFCTRGNVGLASLCGTGCITFPNDYTHLSLICLTASSCRPPPSESVSSSAIAGAAPEPADASRIARLCACARSACSAAFMHSCAATRCPGQELQRKPQTCLQCVPCFPAALEYRVNGCSILQKPGVHGTSKHPHQRTSQGHRPAAWGPGRSCQCPPACRRQRGAAR